MPSIFTNSAAWFGVQYYSQRRRAVLLLGVLGVSVGALVLMGALFFRSLRQSIDSDLKETASTPSLPLCTCAWKSSRTCRANWIVSIGRTSVSFEA